MGRKCPQKKDTYAPSSLFAAALCARGVVRGGRPFNGTARVCVGGRPGRLLLRVCVCVCVLRVRVVVKIMYMFNELLLLLRLPFSRGAAFPSETLRAA